MCIIQSTLTNAPPTSLCQSGGSYNLDELLQQAVSDVFHLYTDPLHAKHSDTACVDSVLHVSCGAAVQSVFATCGDGHKHGRSAIQPYSTDSLIPRLPAEQSWEPGARLLHCQKAIVALCTSCGKLARPLPQCSNLASSCVKCKGPTVRYCTRIKILTPNSTELSALYLLFVG